MRHENEIHDRITYDSSHEEILREYYDRTYWSATEEAEDSLKRIVKLQEQCQGDDNEIPAILFTEEFNELKDATERLEESLNTLHRLGTGVKSLSLEDQKWRDNEFQPEDEGNDERGLVSGGIYHE